MSSPKTRLVLGLALVAVLAIVPSIGTFDAGLVSDDGAALGYVHRAAPLADLAAPQYDLRSFRFWRPLVTLSLELQEATTGVAPVPLRLVNLAGHLAAALLLVGLARRLGVSLAGAVAVGALAALFPYQGGTVTWIVGRVDSLMAPLVLGSLLALVSGRAWSAALLGVLALATKETALVTPLLGVVLLWARRRVAEDGAADGGAQAAAPPWRALLPLAVAVAVTFVLRRLAIGHWIGGYPGGLGAALAGGSFVGLVGDVTRAAFLGLDALGAGLVLAVVVVYTGGVLRGWTPQRRRAATLLTASVLGLALALGPVVTNLAPGQVALEHLRTLYLADLLAALGLGALFVERRADEPEGAVWVRALGPLLLLGLVGLRGTAAWLDTHAWARAGQRADGLVAGVRASLAGVEASDVPVFSATVPRTLDGRYVFHWGFADRFRPPFAATPRPVWPWRPLFDGGEQERRSTTVPRDNLRWPFGEAQRTVPLIRVTDATGALVEHLHLGPDLVAGAGPQLTVEGHFPGARSEALLFTDLGYGVGLYGGPKEASRLAALEDASADPGVARPFGGAIALRDLFLLTPLGGEAGGAPLWRVLAQAADLGATEAWLELRAADDARAQTDRAVGASQWIRVTWDRALRDVLLPWDEF